MAEVEILEVEQTPLNPDLLWGSSIDLPVAGARQDHFGLVVGGWVLIRDTDLAEIELSSEGAPIARWCIDQRRGDVAEAFFEAPVTPICGFMGVIPARLLPPSFELGIEATTPKRRFALGAVRGRRSVIATEPDATDAQPIMVSTLGRTGSTLLMHLLAQHPAVVAHPPFPYEARLATYWASVCDGLSAPSSYLQSLAAADYRRFWWTGHSAFPAQTYVDQDAAARWLGGPALEELGRFARRQVLGFYAASAQMQDKRAAGPQWFAEKRLPLRRLQLTLNELFPAGREIHLVRDFRDMLASISAFSHKRGHAFSHAEAILKGTDYVDHLADSAQDLLRSWRLGGSRELVRYEDLVREPRATLQRILDQLGLDASAGVVDGIFRRAQNSAVAAQLAHRTSPDGGASIGRWKQDLSGEIGEHCRHVLGEALTAFGYEI